MDAVLTDIQSRRLEGAPFEDIAAELASDSRVVDVQANFYAIRFRVEGSAGHWVYDTGFAAEPVDLEAVIASAMSTLKAEPPNGSAVARAISPLVIREGGSTNKLKKKALIVEPFAWQIFTATEQWKTDLLEAHDYEVVDHQIIADLSTDEIDDVYFRNWNDYRFVWITTHGGKEVDEDGREYTVLFSAKPCGYSAWVLDEIEKGRGLDPTKSRVPLSRLFGSSYTTILNELTDAQSTRADAFRSTQNLELSAKGQVCQSQELPTAAPPFGSSASVGFIELVAYDEGWFEDNFQNGLDNVFLYLRSCSAAAAPIDIRSGSDGAIVGWDDIIFSGDDDLTHRELFDHLITKGETLRDGKKAVESANPNLSLHLSNGTFVNWVIRTARGDETDSANCEGCKFRVRENVTIADSATGLPFPDEGGEIDAFEITSEGNTRVYVSVVVEGFGSDMHDDFELQFFNQADMPLSQKVEVREPVDDQTFMTVPIELAGEITMPTDVEIEARVRLPEDGATEKFGRHRVVLKVLPPGEELWRITVPDFGTIKGPVVSAPSVVGVPGDEGVEWLLLLAQEPPAVIPNASVVISGHNGRNQDCTGQTGQFTGGVGFVYTAEMSATGYDGSGEEVDGCPGEVNIDVQTFSREDDLNIALSGTLCKIEPNPVGEGTIATPVPFFGRIKWPRAGCGMTPPVNPLLGSYVSSENVFLCIDIYENSILGPTFEGAFCGTPGVTCDLENACPTDNDLGQCDYRGDSSMLGVRGSVQHYRIGGDWPPIQELEATCVALGGFWSSPL